MPEDVRNFIGGKEALERQAQVARERAAAGPRLTMTDDDCFRAMRDGMESSRLLMEQVRAEATQNGWNARALSIAITELETAQLWLAHATPTGHGC